MESVTFATDIDSCDLQDDDAEASQVVTAYQAYKFSGYEPQPAGFTDLVLEFDRREFSESEHSNLRLLRYGFLDSDRLQLPRVTGDGSFEWAMNYPTADAPGFVAGQPNLIRDAYLKPYNSAGDCGREFEGVPNSAFARVEYVYQKLSDYLFNLFE